MKKSDWAAIILIVAIVGIASYFVVGTIMPSPSENPQTIPIATGFTSDITEPDTAVFNSDAINPTVRITIGNQGDERPFNLGDD